MIYALSQELLVKSQLELLKDSLLKNVMERILAIQGRLAVLS